MTEPLTNDVPDTPGVSFFLNLKASIDTLGDRVAEQNKMLQRRLQMLPRYQTFTQAASITAGTTFWIDYQFPPAGRVWIVRLFSVFASPDPTAAVTGKATLYVGPDYQTAAGIGPVNNARWQFATLPNQQNFTSDVITVNPNEHLLVGLTGLTAPSNTIVNVSVDDIPQWAQAGVYAIE